MRSTAVTARVGRVLGICFGICFVTGVLSHYQYEPWLWLPEPAAPVWGYRLTQGLHVTTGIATFPLLLVKLWSVYPRLFGWPPFPIERSARSLLVVLERLSVAVLVSSALVELVTGFFNVLDWYPWPWDFVPVHRFLGYVVIGSILLHIAIKLPVISEGLSTPLRERPQPGGRRGPSRRGVLTASGAGIGLLVVTTVGNSVTPLSRIGLFAPRKQSQGPFGVPINRTAMQAGVINRANDPKWQLHVRGPKSDYTISLDDLASMSVHEASFPISCVEGWSVGADWRGLKLLDVIERVGGDSGSRVKVTSLEHRGSYQVSYVDGPQVSHALLATHLNGERLNIDHGYPIRLIAPDRAGVLNTKWLSEVEVL
ncbi:molybdopterin-dependent oxidoreductase [Jatrophihabitans endophyticus]|uniref:molybdopterin-dependent oxidoreductase n=1 Tax=Jatrophihabitans endophyticus TaxID=1206085 RepID=UPI0019FFBF40|nr:molybdopterin-dependent oxidoreductase [Jatrophihabitans endophyticus]MBE7189516.1 molybdopterin-dependent oxidoreductase [Jatrophihabitans endophyticus]